jgi:hypothetical protein
LRRKSSQNQDRRIECRHEVIGHRIRVRRTAGDPAGTAHRYVRANR